METEKDQYYHQLETDSPQQVSRQTNRPSRCQPPGCPQPQPPPPGCSTPQRQSQLRRVIDESISSTHMKELVTDTTPFSTSKSSVSSSRLRVDVLPHPLRWDKHANVARYTAHPHKLRLVHTLNIYKQYSGGRFMCDIHGGDYQLPNYVFHCPICLFDICLECVAKPCLNCTAQNCYHNRITIDLL